MINRSVAFIIGIIILVLWIIISSVKKYSISKKILLSIFIIYLTLVLSVTIFPIIFDKNLIYPSPVKLIPFETTIFFINSLINKTASFQYVFLQIFGNIIMTIPFGIIIPFIIKNKKSVIYVIIAFLFPLFIECSQLLMGLITQTMYRTFDVDDIILNFFGIILGYSGYKIIPLSIKRFFKNEK